MDIKVFIIRSYENIVISYAYFILKKLYRYFKPSYSLKLSKMYYSTFYHS